MMMENRVRILIALIILLTFLNITEMVFETHAVEYEVDQTKYKANPDVNFDNYVNAILEPIVIDFEGLPTELMIIFTLINIISLMLIGLIIVTYILDALPFTGG